MPTPIFVTSKRIIAEQPESLNLAQFVKNLTIADTWRWTPGFTPPTGVTLNSPFLSIAANVSETTTELPLNLTAEDAEDPSRPTASAIFTLVVLTTKTRIRQFKALEDRRLRVYLADIDVTDKTEKGIRFTNDIDSQFLNSFTVNAVTLTLDNGDAQFSIQSPRNFFIKHGYPANGFHAPVRILMGYYHADFGEVLRPVFNGRIQNSVITADRRLRITVVNLVTDIVNVPILPVYGYQIPVRTGGSGGAYGGTGVLILGTILGTLHGQHGTNRIRLVNKPAAELSDWEATQSSHSGTIKLPANTPTFFAYVSAVMPNIKNAHILRSFFSANDITNSHLLATATATATAWEPFSTYQDAKTWADRRRDQHYGRPATMWLDADGETLYCVNTAVSRGTSYAYRFGSTFFKCHLPTLRYTILHGFGSVYGDYVAAFVKRSATEYYYLAATLANDNTPRINNNTEAVIKRVRIVDGGTNVTTTEAETVNVRIPWYPTGSDTVKFIAWSGGTVPRLAVPTMSMDGDTYRVLCMTYVGTVTSQIFVQFNVYERNVTDSAGVWSLAHGNTWDAPAGSGGARGQDDDDEQHATHRDPVTGRQVVNPTGRGWFDETRNARGTYQGPVHIMDTDTLALWYNEPAQTNIAGGVRCKEVGTAIPFSLHQNNDLTAAGIVQGEVSRAVTLNNRTFFVAGGRLYERQTRITNLAANVNGGGGGYHCRAIGTSADIGSPVHFYSHNNATYAVNPTNGTIYRIETNGTVTLAHPALPSLTYTGDVNSPDAQWNGRYVPSNAPPVIYQNSPLVYANYTCPGNAASRGYLKSFMRRTTETLTYGILGAVGNFGTGDSNDDDNPDMFSFLTSLAVSNYAYWYFDIERLYFRYRQRDTYMFHNYDASTGTLRYERGTSVQRAELPSSGEVLIGHEVLSYSGVGTETIGETTYPTLTGITRALGAHETKHLVGEAVTPISVVLRTGGINPEVLSLHYDSQRVNRIEKLQLNVLGSDEVREPVQINPGEKVTELDVLSTSNISPAELERLYQADYAGESVIITASLVPDFSLTIGDTVYLESEEHALATLGILVSITYAIDALMEIKLRTISTPPRQSWPLPFGHPTQRGIAYDTASDRLYISFTTPADLRYFETNVVTGEVVDTANSVFVESTGIRRAGNMAVHAGYLYLKSARYENGAIHRFNLETFQFEAGWQYLPTGHTFGGGGGGGDELIVDVNGDIWLNTDSTARTLTKLTLATGTISPTNRSTFSTETITYPAGLHNRRFTYWNETFWGIDFSGDAPVLTGFKKENGTVSVTRTLPLPSNLFAGDNFSGFTRGRHGWYFVTRTNLYFVPDAE